MITIKPQQQLYPLGTVLTTPLHILLPRIKALYKLIHIFEQGQLRSWN